MVRVCVCPGRNAEAARGRAEIAAEGAAVRVDVVDERDGEHGGFARCVGNCAC